MEKSLICLFASLSLVVYSLHFFPYGGSQWVEQFFSWGWLLFAVLVISSHSVELLYKRKKNKRNQKTSLKGG